jgi:cytochrome c-type biogenesis protein CcmE
VKPVSKLFYLIVLLAVAGVFTVIVMYNKTDNGSTLSRADFILTASELSREFSSDEPAANQKYIGKTIELKGQVTSLNFESDKVVSVILKTSDEMSSVICTFRRSIDPKSFDTMKPVIVRGELSGYLMDVMLNNCELVN